MKHYSTLKDIKQILKDLINANDTRDAEIISFYTKKVEVETAKALRKLEVKKMLLSNN